MNQLPPMTIPEILWELSAIPNTKLRKVAKMAKFPKYTTMKTMKLRNAMVDACDVDKPKTFNVQVLNRIHEVLR